MSPRFIVTSLLVVAAAIVAMILLILIASAHDGQHDDWFASLKQPGSNVSCCNLVDCKPEPWRQTKTGYEVLIGGEWVEVPPEKILQQTTNPVGHAITCHAGKTIFCFVRESET